MSIGVSAVAKAGRGLSLATLPSIAWSPFEYILGRKGLMSTNHVEAGGFARTDAGLEEPDVQFHMIPARVGVGSKGIVWGRGYFADVCLLKPESRGNLTLKKNGDRFEPLIDFNALGDERDREQMVAAFKLLRSIMDSEPFSRLAPIEESPGVQVQSDEQILEHCRRRLGTAYHPVGTCRMGATGDPRSVVDPIAACHRSRECACRRRIDHAGNYRREYQRADNDDRRNCGRPDSPPNEEALVLI